MRFRERRLAEDQRKRTDDHAARRYRHKAERLRTIAANMPGDARNALLQVAESYDNMAAREAGSSLREPASMPPAKDKT
jgi:hypothetical protein